MLYTTLNKIRSKYPCGSGWRKLLTHLNKTQADDELVSFLTILESNGLDDALWCLRAVDGHEREMRLYAIWCARQVQYLLSDPQSRTALDVAERYACGKATHDELIHASCSDAMWVARTTTDDVAAIAASQAAWSARGELAALAWNAGGLTAGAAACDASTDAQTAEFVRVFCT